MRALILLCLLAAGTASAQQFYCMTGIPCGNGCTMGDGLCINGRCFDRTGRMEWECMAPMRAGPMPLRLQDSSSSSRPATAATPAAAATGASTSTPSASSTPAQQQQQVVVQQPSTSSSSYPWMPRLPAWQQSWVFPTWQPAPAFPFFKPWAQPSFAPIMPMPGMPGMMMPFAEASCGGKGPCARGQFCDAQGVCRADDCVSQFKYGCASDGGELQKIACPHFSGFKECYASSTGGFRCFKGPSGSTLACASQSGNAAGASWTSAGGSFNTYPTMVDDVDDFAEEQEDAPAAPTTSTSSGAAAATTTTPAAPAASSSSGAAAAAAPAAQPAAGKPSAFRKVATEAGPAAATGPAAAAPADPKKALAAASPTFLMQNANELNQQPPRYAFNPQDGSAVMSAGPGTPGAIGMMDVAPNGMGMAAGMASGDQKTVVTRRGPDGGMSSMSSSVSTNGGPAIASSVSGR